MTKRVSFISVSVLLLALIGVSSDAMARINNQGIWACTDRFKTCIDWCGSTPNRHPLLLA